MTLITFINIPVRIISGIFKYPEPKTMAFGGVATGSIKAQDAATVIPTINVNGWTSKIKAIGAITGKSIAVVARLDVISVRKLTASIKTNSNANNGRLSN